MVNTVISAYQSAKLTAGQNLASAHHKLIEIRSLVCFSNDQARRIASIVADIDQLLQEVIPNDAG